LLKLNFFGKSALVNKVIIGKDQEMFPSSEFIIDDFVGEMKLDVPQLISIRQSIIERIQYLENRGVDYYLFFAPNKQSIYPDKLPSKYTKRHKPGKTMLDQLLQFFQHDSIIIDHSCDVRSNLRSISASKEIGESLYYKNDLHWNAHGAFIGYHTLFQKMAKKNKQFIPYEGNDFEINRYIDQSGDLASMLLLHKDEPRTVIEYHLKEGNRFMLEPIYGKDRYPYFHSSINDEALPRALVFRDSFCQEMMQFISLHFSDALYVWNQEFNEDLIAEQKANVVIQEVTEMFIYELLNVNSDKVKVEFEK